MNPQFSHKRTILNVLIGLFFFLLIEAPAIGSAEPMIGDGFTSQFTRAHLFSDSLAAVRIGNHYGFIDKRGKIVITPQFDEAHDFSEGVAVVKISGRYGFIDKEGNMAFVPQFFAAHDFSNGRAAIVIGDTRENHFYVDNHSRLLVNQQFGATPGFKKKYDPSRYWGI